MLLGKKQALATQRGVTLMELMIVVAVVGILATIAYPSYNNFMTDTNRSDAHVALAKLANDMDKYYSECGAYTTSITSAGRACPPGGSLGKVTTLSDKQHYQMSIALTSTGYTLTATPQGGQATRDTACGSLTLSNTGATGATGTSTSRCWRK